MKRSALRTLLRRLAMASLPLAGAACGNGGNPDMSLRDAASTGDFALRDAASTDDSALRDAASSGDSALRDGASAVVDMAVPLEDLSGGDLFDLCLGRPELIKVLPLPDGGAGDCFSACEAASPPNYVGAVMCKEVKTDGGQAIECSYSPCAFGRRPAGLLAARSFGATSEIGDWLARAAHLEAASVVAFRRLADELCALGAPRALVDSALRAAEDEVHHARIVSALARSHGVTPAAVELSPIGARSPEEIAIENAVEGCVGETWGALLALRQAKAARAPSIRHAMRRIAKDELRHAELAFEVADFVLPRLTPAARERVATARRSAADRILKQLETPSETMRLELGLPDEQQAKKMARSAARILWI